MPLAKLAEKLAEQVGGLDPIDALAQQENIECEQIRTESGV